MIYLFWFFFSLLFHSKTKTKNHFKFIALHHTHTHKHTYYTKQKHIQQNPIEKFPAIANTSHTTPPVIFMYQYIYALITTIKLFILNPVMHIETSKSTVTYEQNKIAQFTTLAHNCHLLCRPLLARHKIKKQKLFINVLWWHRCDDNVWQIIKWHISQGTHKHRIARTIHFGRWCIAINGRI